MAANSWVPGHGCISANANLADPWYSVLGTQALVLKRPLFSSLPAANAEQAVVLPVPDCHAWWVCGLGEWAVLMPSVFVRVLCFLTFVWTEMSHLSAFRRAEEKGKMIHVIGLSSGCLVQMLSPLDCSFLFLLVLVPLYKGKQVPSIAGVNLEILVNCWEWEKEWCIARQEVLISLILAVCKGAGLDLSLFHVLLRPFHTFQSTQYSHPTEARRGWSQSCISQMETQGMYKEC